MPPSLSRLGALKSQTSHVQPIDKCIDDPAHVIVRNQLFQGDRKEGCLGPAFALHIAHKKDALAFTKASSHLFSDGQQSFVTIWSPPAFFFTSLLPYVITSCPQQ